MPKREAPLVDEFLLASGFGGPDTVSRLVVGAQENRLCVSRSYLGVAHQRTKNPPAAATQFREALKLDPGYLKGEEIRKYLADLSKS